MRAQALLFGGVLSASALGLVGARELSLVGVHQGYAPEQPIAFSHQLHAGEHRIACLYCHFAAARSRHAGIPPANVCMNCHGVLRRQTAELQELKEAVAQGRPVQWVKVHNLPDFVYFNHSEHVLARVACRDCHGAVETMVRVRQDKPLTMGWCLECHRERGRGPTASLPHTTRPLAGLDCGKCHY